MPTRVINIRSGAEYDVYCGRPGPFGNPFQAGTRSFNCDNFEELFLSRVATDKSFRAQVLKLKGKTLGCWCKPQRCHADTIARWLDSQS